MHYCFKSLSVSLLLISHCLIAGCNGPGPTVDDSAADAAQEAAEQADPEASEEDAVAARDSEEEF